MEDLRKMIKSEEFAKYVDDYIDERNEKLKKVESKEYIDWLYQYIKENKYIEDEHMLYCAQGIDKDNGLLISTFMDMVMKKGEMQNVSVSYDVDEMCFTEERIFVQIKDVAVELSRLHGQGTITMAVLLKTMPTDKFVKIG